jgi:hypothetical protein
VTGEKNSSLQPMQVVKGDQYGYPVYGGTAGPPCPGSYKYGSLALQVGVCKQTNKLSLKKS